MSQIIEVKVPVLPESVSDATIASWHKKAGDAVPATLVFSSGARLKVSVENDSRDRQGALTWGDRVWAHWLPSSQVVLTQ